MRQTGSEGREGVSTHLSISRSLREYGRGIAGGLLFSLPLLYTMEVWWAGFVARPLRLLVYLAVGFLLLCGYNRYAGLHKDASWLEVVFEAIEEMGIGLFLAALFLWLLGQIDGSTPASELVGKVVVEAVTVAIGVSVGSSQLGSAGQGKSGGPSAGGMEDGGRMKKGSGRSGSPARSSSPPAARCSSRAMSVLRRRSCRSPSGPRPSGSSPWRRFPC